MRHGWSLFDVRNEFPDAWHVFQSGTRRDRECDRLLTLSLTRRLFPFLPCDRALMVLRFGILFETREAREYACCQGEYTCCGDPAPMPARAAAGASRTCATATRTPAPTARRTAAASASELPRGRVHSAHAPRCHPGECECDNIDVRCVASGAVSRSHGDTSRPAK